MSALPRGFCFRQAGILVGAMLALAGCSPWSDRVVDEDHPLIHQAVARKAVNPAQAAQLLEQVLESNPRLARAHWELALIHLNATSNYAAAVYHFQRVLALQPNWPHANTATQLINQAKLDLVREGVEVPTLPSAQRQIDRYVAEIHRLNATLTNLQERVRSLTEATQHLTVQNLQLRQQLLALNAPPVVQPGNRAPATAAREPPAAVATTPRERAAPARTTPPPRPQATTAPTPNRRESARPPTITPTASPSRPSAPSANSAGARRAHTVRPGDTAASVAKRYHLTLRDLRNANPGVDLGRLQPGQTLRLP